MVFKARNKLGLFLGLALVCASVMAEETPNKSFRDIQISFGVPTSLKETPSFNLLIEKTLYQNILFERALKEIVRTDRSSLVRPQVGAIDCSVLNSLLEIPVNSVYLTIDHNNPDAFSGKRCLNNKEGLYGVVLVNPDELNKYSEVLASYLLVSSVVSLVKNSEAIPNVKVGSVCQQGYFNVFTGSCNRSRFIRTTDTTLMQNFTFIASFSTADYAISAFYDDPRVELDFFNYMVEDLYNETIGYANTSAIQASCDFMGINQALLDLIGLTNFLDESSAETLFDIVEYALIPNPTNDNCTSDPGAFYPFDGLIQFCEAYLSYYKSTSIGSGITAEYESKVQRVDWFLNRLMLNLFGSGSPEEPVDTTFSSSNNDIELHVTINTGNLLGCSCTSFCTSSNFVMEVDVTYHNLGYWADPFSLNYYNLADIANLNGIPSYTFYSGNSTSHMATATPLGCLAFSASVHAGSSSSTGWGCATPTDYTQSCATSNSPGTSVTFVANSFGLYELYPVCSERQGPLSSNYSCGACNDGCYNCTFAHECSSCEPNFTPIMSGGNLQCQCNGAFYENSNSDCVACGEHCLGCNSTDCLNCAPTYQNDLGNMQNCVCAEGKYDNGTTCINCDQYCVNCNSTQCLECQHNYDISGEQCLCNATSYDDNGSGCVQCQTSYGSCQTCNHSSCVECNSNYKIISGNCGCDGSNFNNGTGCESCGTYCSECSDANSCTTCESNYEEQGFNCGCNLTAFDNMGNGCVNCSVYSEKCESCNINECSECSSNYVPGLNCSCNSNQYDNGEECQNCSTHCNSCSESSCFGCSYNYNVAGSDCLCNSNQYDNTTGCTNCDSTLTHCSQCTNSSVCEHCSNNYMIIQGACGCDSGNYDNSNGCSPCSDYNSNCAECNSTHCTTCEYNYVLSGNDCICNSNQYNNSGDGCVDCHEHCLQCNSTDCLSCSYNYEIDEKDCVCNSTSFNNFGSGCVACDTHIDHCESCVNQSSCSNCYSNYTVTNGECACEAREYDNGSACINCGEKCAACNQTDCVACDSGYHNLGTYCGCNPGETDTGSGCQNCDDHCSNCTSTGCSECEYNYEPSGFNCICPSGLYSNNSGCESCNPKFEYCAECNSTQCTNCELNYVLLPDFHCGCGSMQYNNNSGCSECGSNCDSCSNGTVCESCHSNYVNVGDSNCGCGTGDFDNGTECLGCGETYNHCVTCNKNTCLDCNSNYTLAGGVCGCGSAKYDNGIDCSACSSHCNSCNSTVCSSCDSNYVPQGFNCECNSGSYNNNTGCASCDSLFDNCELCDSTTCSKCSSNYAFNGTDCSCGSKQFDNSTACENCGYQCQSCSDYSQCEVCSESYIENGFNCECGSGKYDNSTYCLACDEKYPLCSECNSTMCLSCKFNYDLNSASQCSCNSTSYDNNNQGCISCGINCETCTNGTKCEVCASNYVDVGDNCGCEGATYDNGTACVGCSAHCNSCSATACLSCDSNYEKQGLDCICNATSYDTGSSCESCLNEYGAHCNSCNTTDCLVCDPSYTLVNDDHCSCLSNQYDNSTGCTNCGINCETCDSTECTQCASNYTSAAEPNCGCETGLYDYGSGCQFCNYTYQMDCTQCNPQACTHCFGNYSLINNNQECGCHSNQFEVVDGCANCGYKCSECSNFSSCASCESNYEIGGFDCTCDEHSYDNSTGCMECSQTYPKCDMCTSASCSHCSSNYTLNLNTHQCVCGPNQYDMGSGCDVCGYGCESCTNGTSCAVCSSNYKNQGFDCGCDSDSYDSGSNCVLCSVPHQHCNKCNDTACIGCSSNYTLASGNCACLSDQYESSEACHDCGYKCNVCDGTSCSSCESTYSANGMDCECPSGKYDNSTQCVDCSVTYDHCHLCNSTDCTSCSSNYTLDASHDCVCGPNQFDNGQGCANCGNLCHSCSNYSECAVCNSNYVQLGFDCGCAEGTYDNSNSCVDCGTNCHSCSNSSECAECKSNYVSSGFNCECPPAHYDNGAGAGCTACNTHCTSCSSSSCSNCESNYTASGKNCICGSAQYDSGTVCVDCQANCNACNSSDCTNCASPFVPSGANCVCPPSHYQSGNTCVACGSHCDNCTSSGCTACSSTFTKNNGDGTCSCPTDYVISASTSLCVQGYRYLLSGDVTGLVFDSSYTYLSFTTSKFIVQASSNCGDYFINAGILGTGATCTFTSSDVIKITLGSGFTIIPSGVTNSAVALNVKTTLLTTNGPLLESPSPSITVTATTLVTPPNPTIVLNGPTSVSSYCSSQDFTYDATGTFGPVQSSFTYTWLITQNSNTISPLSGGNGYLTVTFTIADFTDDITLTLTVTNVFGSSSTLTKSISVSTINILGIRVDPSSQTIPANQKLLVQGSVSSICSALGPISYSWSSDQLSEVIIYQNLLSIPAEALGAGTYTFNLEATLTLGSGAVVSEIVTSTITITSSPVSVSLNSNNLQIPDNSAFVITASASDPDSATTQFTYSWSLNPIPSTSPSSSTNSLSVPTTYLSANSAFTVTVTATAGGRSASATSSFTVVPGSPVSISFNYNGQKVAVSSALTISSTITLLVQSSSSVSLAWSRVSGPSTPSVSGSTPIISFAAGTLSPGSTYKLQLLATLGSASTAATVSVPTNQGASCPDTYSPSPASGKKLSTLITFAIRNCVDQDNQDYPLYYTLRIQVGSSSSLTVVGIPTQSNSFAWVGATANTYYANILVTDSLKDGNSYKSSALTITNSFRRNLQTETISDLYSQQIQILSPIIVVSNFLMSETLPVDLLDTMWVDFTSYIEILPKDLDTLRVVDSVVNLFMNDYQFSSLTYDRIKTYTTYLSSVLAEVDYVDNEESQLIASIASRILDVSEDITYLLLAQDLLESLSEVFDTPLAAPLSQNTAHISIYKVETFVNLLSMSPIVLGSGSVSVGALQVPQDIILNAKAILYDSGIYSDIISISIDSDKTYANYRLSNENTQISYSNQVVVTLPVKNSEISLGCAKFVNSEWVAQDCSYDSDTKQITVNADGLYTLIPSEELSGISSPLYMIISLVLLACISVPFMLYLDKNSPYLSVPTFSATESRSDRVIKFPTESEVGEARRENIIFNHLLISLIKPKQVFTRSKRVLLLISNIVLEIFLQNLLISNLSMNPATAGIVSVLPTLVISLITTVLLSNSNQAAQVVGIVIMLAVYIVSIVGMYFTVASSGWFIALLVGLATEIVVAQTIVMGITKFLKI